MTARTASVNAKNVIARTANAVAAAVASVKENASVNLRYLSDNNYSCLFQYSFSVHIILLSSRLSNR